MTRITASRRRRMLSTIGIIAAPALLLPMAFAPSAQAAEAPAMPVGLFGSQDATYDGVYRQSLALLAYVAEDEEPPAEAVNWLLEQQCDDGGFQAFRADTSVPCAESDAASYSGPDSNSTAVAINALTLLGEDEAAEIALDFLSELQQEDGGISYYAGGSSDANSTALAAMAITAYGEDPDDATNDADNSIYDGLDALQLGCSYDGGDQGAYAYMAASPLIANDFATSQATIGRAGQALPIDVAGPAASTLPSICGAGGTPPEFAAAVYLANRLDANGGTIPDAFNPGGTDWGSTRFAVMSLAAVGIGGDALVDAWNELDENQDTFLVDGDNKDRPAALAEMILATNAAAPTLATLSGASVKRSVVAGQTDTGELLERLTATLVTEDVPPTDEPTDPTDDGTNGSTTPETEATNGGTELADSGSTSVPVAASGLALAAMGALLIVGARRFWIDDATTA